jgi:hypothetical protein
MSLCTYYRRDRCASQERCQYKILMKDGKVLCQKDGQLGTIEVSSRGYRKV